ncbi:phosphoribosylformylglycinamidine synthase [Sedimentibacter hydroxybenzoicus DSM 7310]|uniref:Phosphoribosylformylglycinamidine synthase n=1 Tax=Sedimentibacter hydroxybenzoicus DSM 7310 TaxID=1123245 RepID=A0A974BKM9_SEDHY|nr:phosphoribosylformylglycinamidine synthase [Sedimentibacter hydroxybenzoicus]NYB74914.1 phosphoribosylformylglycinamidine synthase [Sedimentibacter hydroxybenzoicus DSM 7310]
MNFDVKRVFVEKKSGFNTESINLLNDFKENLQLNNLKNIRILNRYLVSNLSNHDFSRAVATVFSEPNQDNVYFEDIGESDNVFAVEFLPGQYDQRADSASQCIRIITDKEEVKVKYAKIIILEGELTKEDITKIKKYFINPVDSRETDLDGYAAFYEEYAEASDVEYISNFTDKSEKEVEELRISMGLAMSFEDLLFCQEYFKDTEKRNPTITEMKVIDTYWSDHCRHTTFNTQIEKIEFENGKINKEIQKTLNQYFNSRKYVYENKQRDISLMDLATINAKELRKSGYLNDLEISDEINACSITINVDVECENEEWLLMFKNETHNHPTEIEPFGGAATCIGGAIRDPLSGRSYVYQAMRITGSGDPRQKIEDTIPGKLPQRKISTEAAAGYSSYGNQIGLATGYVNEIYHPGYVAKRMEVGAVIAAAKKENVRREAPVKGDVVILLGGRTGRDGLGGATGSSKEHDEKSIIKCGSEVQKGNAPTERKIQRLFRNEKVSLVIKKCNDFGAGGVSVAIGELADGLNINLDAVPKKYDGLDGTELAISESQERMAVVVSKGDAQKFIKYAHEENLEATIVAEVTDDRRLKMTWRGKLILDIDRNFLDTNGVKQGVIAFIKEPAKKEAKRSFCNNDLKEAWLENLRDLNVASQKGMVERFDSTVGAGSVLMPFGGFTQLTPAEGMIAKIPVLNKDTNTCSIMTYGFDPFLSELNQYHGAMYAVIHSVAKAVAMGADYRNIRLTFQEYFEKLNKEPEKWGKVLSALLGAYKVQHELNVPAIGGKDSMSGTFKDMNVPPTLISFAVSAADVNNIISPEFKKAGSKVLLVSIKKDDNLIPDFEDIKNKYGILHDAISDKKVLSAHTVGYGGVAAAISKMTLGNQIGFKASYDMIMDKKEWFSSSYGDIILEADEVIIGTEIGVTSSDKEISLSEGFSISLNEVKNNWMKTFENIYPVKKDAEGKINSGSISGVSRKKANVNIAKPRVFIPVFPGTNCEYDTQRAFKRAGAETDVFIFNNLSSLNVSESIKEMNKRIKKSQIIAFPGGFSAGDEPEGSGKFIASVFRNEFLEEAVMDLLNNRDGLIIGICNGFQALIKLGLVPFGEIVEIKEDYPTLTYNKIGRHVSGFVRTKVVNNTSPWLNKCSAGDVHYLPVSHGEGKFAASEEWISRLKAGGQIATQYVDLNNEPTYDGLYNPNGSIEAVEGITSPDGRVLGKMAHSERIDNNLYKNIPGEKNQLIFESGVQYFK